MRASAVVAAHRTAHKPHTALAHLPPRPPSPADRLPSPPFPPSHGTAGALGWVLLSLAAHSMGSAFALIMLTSAASAVSDVVVDSMVVERARREEQVGLLAPIPVPVHQSAYKEGRRRWSRCAFLLPCSFKPKHRTRVQIRIRCLSSTSGRSTACHAESAGRACTGLAFGPGSRGAPHMPARAVRPRYISFRAAAGACPPPMGLA